MAPKATDPVIPKAGSSAAKEKEEKPLSKKELAAKKEG